MSHTYGEQFDSAIKCETPADAEAWMEKEIAYRVSQYGQTVTDAIAIIKSNLGYMAGYYDKATQEKIARLFNAPHPGFDAFQQLIKHRKD